MKNNRKKNVFSSLFEYIFGKDDSWITVYIGLILLIGITVNLFMAIPFPTISTLSSGDWLGFWGGFLGGAIGCFPALAALHLSRKEAERQHEESRTDRRLSVMPIFDCQIKVRSCYGTQGHAASGCIDMTRDGVLRVPSEYELDDEFFEPEPHVYTIELRNCGLSPAIQSELHFNHSHIDLNVLTNGITTYYGFSPCWDYFKQHSEQNSGHDIIELHLLFMDIFGNHYTQKISLQYYFCGDAYGKYLEFRTTSVGQPILASAEKTSSNP